MNSISLYIPDEDELEYRQFLIADEETMLYNKGFGDDGGSTYRQSPERLAVWYKRWNNGSDSFYAYVKVQQAFVGEVSIHYDEESHRYIASIILQAEYRGKGYALEALRLLVEHGFYSMDLDALYDSFSVSRQDAEKLFAEAGFERIAEDWVELLKEDYIKLQGPEKMSVQADGNS